MSSDLTRRHFVTGLLTAAWCASCSNDRDRSITDDRTATSSATTEGTTTTSTSTTDRAPTTDGAGSEYFPYTTEWETLDKSGVEAAGWSSDALEELAAFVGESNSQSLVVLVGGRIASEHYWSGADADSVREIASCQKSVVSTLCGIAIDRGLLELDDPVTDHLGRGWTAAPASDEKAITVRHLLSMTSGLNTRTLKAAAPPGTVWEYNTAAYQKLRSVLEAVAGSDINALTRSWLWDPIEVSTASAWRERLGEGELAMDATGARLWSLDMTARDMARFGLLVQRRGQWAGEKVVATSWLDQALSPSQEMNKRYGFLWWLPGAVATSPRVPRDLVAALGAGDQKIYVSTSLDCVLVRQGAAVKEVAATASSFDPELIRMLLAAAPGQGV